MLLYIILIHHQTTTAGTAFAESHPLYIIFIHHQTTTVRVRWYSPGGCISSLFITKPQLIRLHPDNLKSCISSLFITKPQLKAAMAFHCTRCISSLFITKPQLCADCVKTNIVVSHPYSSPNHNLLWLIIATPPVVSHPYSSPNHNQWGIIDTHIPLYLILIHHQTTTLLHNRKVSLRCISSLFITKPQLVVSCALVLLVVSHPYSSPNHNLI